MRLVKSFLKAFGILIIGGGSGLAVGFLIVWLLKQIGLKPYFGIVLFIAPLFLVMWYSLYHQEKKTPSSGSR